VDITYEIIDAAYMILSNNFTSFIASVKYLDMLDLDLLKIK